MNKESAIELCHYLNIDIEKEDNRKGELRCLCPFHEDKMSSFGINWEKEMWNCFAGCGAGAMPKLIKRIKKLDTLSVNKVLKKFGIINSVLSVLPSYEQLQKNKKEKFEDLDESILDDFSSKPVKYFKKRGFSTFEWMDWKLRFNEENKSIVFPVYTEKKLLIGWTERFIRPQGSRYAQFLSKKIAMYGLDKLENRKQVLIVEGNLDTIRANTILHNFRIKCDVIGLIGLGINKYKASFIKSHYDNAIIMMDNDEEGIQGKYLVKKHLEGINTIYFRYKEDEIGTDVCEIHKSYFVKEIIRCLHQNSKRLGLLDK